MNELQVLDEKDILGRKVTMYGDIENPLFLARDVARWIDYDTNKVGQMLNTVDEEEKITSPIYYSGQIRNMWFVTEDGLYEVLMQSRKPIAREFKKKVKKLLKDLRLNNFNMYTNLSPELQAIFELDVKQQRTEKRVDYLYNTMTIDYEQQETLSQLAKSRAVEILGGKGTPAYKKVSKKLFQELWRDFKRYFKVNSYKNTARKNYEYAMSYLSNWNASYNLRMEIEAINKQMVFEG